MKILSLRLLMTHHFQFFLLLIRLPLLKNGKTQMGLNARTVKVNWFLFKSHFWNKGQRRHTFLTTRQCVSMTSVTVGHVINILKQ
jgi:hypothetical protein